MKTKNILIGIMVFVPVLLIVTISHNFPIKFVKESIWSIGIYTGNGPLNIKNDEIIENPVLDASDVTDVDAVFIADPFIFNKNSIWYMFFEVLNRKDMKGDIGYAYSYDFKKWNYGNIVLDCQYHISYPYIFEWNGKIFMIPESAEHEHLILYVAEDFPDVWNVYDTIMNGKFGDHAIFRHNEIWWLMACSEPRKNNFLRLFYSDSLNSEWKEHPMSPIISDNANKARPGGRVLIVKDTIIRFAQDCDPTYGREVNAFYITKLDKEQYCEMPVMPKPVIKGGKCDWNRHGMHHVDAYKINDSAWIAAVDGYKKKISIILEY